MGDSQSTSHSSSSYHGSKYSPVSSGGCFQCQHCGAWTNYAAGSSSHGYYVCGMCRAKGY